MGYASRAVVSVIALSVLAAVAPAQTEWIKSPASPGNWGTSYNWSPDEPTYNYNDPTGQAFIDNGGTARVTLEGEEAYLLFLGSESGTSGNVLLESGSLATASAYIGANGDGSLTQSGGSFSASYLLYAGAAGGSTGSLTLTGDGRVSEGDLAILAAHWQEGAMVIPPSMIPEPATVSLLAVGLVGMIACRRG